VAEDSVLLGCDAALLGSRLPTFQGIVAASYFEATDTAYQVKLFHIPQEQILQ